MCVCGSTNRYTQYYGITGQPGYAAKSNGKKRNPIKWLEIGEEGRSEPKQSSPIGVPYQDATFFHAPAEVWNVQYRVLRPAHQLPLKLRNIKILVSDILVKKCYCS